MLKKYDNKAERTYNQYKVYTLRLSKKTWKKFKKVKEKSGKSWNMFILKDILGYENKETKD